MLQGPNGLPGPYGVASSNVIYIYIYIYIFRHPDVNIIAIIAIVAIIVNIIAITIVVAIIVNTIPSLSVHFNRTTPPRIGVMYVTTIIVPYITAILGGLFG